MTHHNEIVVRKHVELDFTMDAEEAAITRGLAESGKTFDYPVHLFLTDGGLLASVQIESDEPLSDGEVIDLAQDLAQDEIDQYHPGDENYVIPEPWRTLVVDHDLMAENLRREPMSPVRPAQPVDGDEAAA